MKASDLHVISVISNPVRWHSRIRLFHEYVEQMLQSGVKLTVVECAYGNRPYQIPHHDRYYQLVRVRSNSMCWNKENLINIGISRLPDDWRYVAWVDADIKFRSTDWAYEAVHGLQQYPILQPWAWCIDLGPNGEVIDNHKSFAYLHWHGKFRGVGPAYEFCHPGYAWCARRSAIDRVGGLIDFAICGAADHHMALSMIGKVMWSVPKGISEDYMDPLMEWQKRAISVTHKNLGYLPGSIEHAWHGSKDHRKYIDRWQILIRNNYEPDTDIKRNTYGVVELSGSKPQLTHDLDVYMRERSEDLTWKTPPNE